MESDVIPDLSRPHAHVIPDAWGIDGLLRSIKPNFMTKDVEANDICMRSDL